MVSASGSESQDPPDNVEVVPVRIPAPGELPGYTPPGEAPWGGGRSPEYSQEDPMLVANPGGDQHHEEEERPTSALGQLVHYIKRYSILPNLFTRESLHQSQIGHTVFKSLIPGLFFLWRLFKVLKDSKIF